MSNKHEELRKPAEIEDLENTLAHLRRLLREKEDEINRKDLYIAELEAALPDEKLLGEIMVNDEGLLQSQKVIDCHQKDLEVLPVGTKIYAHMEKT